MLHRCAGCSIARHATRRCSDPPGHSRATTRSMVGLARTTVRPVRLNVALMRSLAAWCHDRRRTVIGLWVGAFILLAALWATAAGDYVNNFRLPGTESQRAYDLLKDKFPQQAGDTASVVFAVKDGAVLDHKPQIDKTIATIKKSPEVLAVSDPSAQGAPVSKDGRITFAQIQFKKAAGDVDAPAVKKMAEQTLKLD